MNFCIQGHRLLELTGETELVIDKLVFCKTHENKILELYCNQCKDVICMMCFVVNHTTHDTVTVEQALSKILPEVDHDLGNIRKKLEDITKAIDETDKEKIQVEQTFDKCLEIVDKKFEERMEQMHDAQREIKEKIKKERELQVFLGGLRVANPPIRLMSPTSVRPHFRFRTRTQKHFVQSNSNLTGK